MSAMVILYILVGAIFGFWFLAYALPKRDANAVGTGWAFRVMVFPGCVLLWPILIFNFHGEWRHADLRARRRHARIWAVLPVSVLILVSLALLFRTPINIRP